VAGARLRRHVPALDRRTRREPAPACARRRRAAHDEPAAPGRASGSNGRGAAGAGALLRWLASQRAEAAGGEEAQVRLESDRNLVQIVTIHKAKGLEYPIVFCPFAWDGFLQVRDEPPAIEYHGAAGQAVIDFRPDASDEKPIKRARKEELAAERVRLIYVALTRAIQRCYLIAGCYVKGGSRPSPGRASAACSTGSLRKPSSRTRIGRIQR
jgi:ATP-dependent exoDNAse (exonuclease V) beta subunit